MCDPSIFIRQETQELMRAPTRRAVARTRTAGWRLPSPRRLTGKLPGRIGDSPIPGAGFYPDDRFGAVCGTGQGEAFIRLGLARVMVVELQARHGRGAVASGAIGWLTKSLTASGGVIVIRVKGRPKPPHTPAMPYRSPSDGFGQRRRAGPRSH